MSTIVGTLQIAAFKVQEPKLIQQPAPVSTNGSSVSRLQVDIAQAPSPSGVAIDDWSDYDVIERIAQADASALEVFYDRHNRKAYGLAYHLLEDAGAAEEVVQEAFLAVWRHAQSYKISFGTVRSWFLSIVHHRAIDYLRRRQTRDNLHQVFDEAQLPPARSDTWQEAVMSMDGEQVRQALHALPRAQSEVLVLAYFRGMTHDEIARYMNIPLGTAKGRLRLGLQGLRQILDESGSGGG